MFCERLESTVKKKRRTEIADMKSWSFSPLKRSGNYAYRVNNLYTSPVQVYCVTYMNK